MQFKKFIWPIVHKWRKLIYPIRMKKYEQKIYNNYSLKGINSFERRLVCMQDSNFSHGGLVDRMKGIVSGYFLAKKYSLSFSVYFSDADDSMIPYLNPKVIDIISEESKVNFNKDNSRPVVWYNHFPDNPGLIKQRIFSKREIHLYCNMNLLQVFSDSEIAMKQAWSEAFSQIFMMHEQPIGNTMGIHLRFIGLLGDFKDLRNYGLVHEQKIGMIEWCENKILEIGMKNPDYLLKIVSDSSGFLTELLTKEKFASLRHRLQVDSSSIGHTAINVNDIVFKKTVDDFIGLRSCEKVIQLRYGKMHRSDFSRYAAISGLKEYELIEYNVG